MRVPVVGASDRTKSLLARCVPDLESDELVAHLDGFHLKIYPDGRDVAVPEIIVDKADHERGLATALHPDDDHFDQLVVRALADVRVGFSEHLTVRFY